MECLRTPRGAGAKGLKELGEGGVGAFRAYKGRMLSFCDPPLPSISWLPAALGADIVSSIKDKRGFS